MIEVKKTELQVIAKAKQLSEQIFIYTECSPKKYRFTLVSKMQNLSLSIISELYSANDTYVSSKTINDMNTVIEHIKGIKSYKSEEERLHYKNKLFELKLGKAQRLSELAEKRLNHSYAALTASNELDFIITLAAKMQCITAKQQTQLAASLYEVRRLICGFIKSDKKRFDL